MKPALIWLCLAGLSWGLLLSLLAGPALALYRTVLTCF
jgi:hypothetical protein